LGAQSDRYGLSIVSIILAPSLRIWVASWGGFGSRYNGAIERVKWDRCPSKSLILQICTWNHSFLFFRFAPGTIHSLFLFGLEDIQLLRIEAGEAGDVEEARGFGSREKNSIAQVHKPGFDLPRFSRDLIVGLPFQAHPDFRPVLQRRPEILDELAVRMTQIAISFVLPST